MKLALYLPNFRDKVTVSEIVDLARLAEELAFDSVWTLDRIVVPEASDRQELRKPFGFMKEFPHALPVASRGEFLHGLPLIPYLAAITKKVRIGVSVIDTPYRAPGVLAAEIGTWDHLSGGRVNVAVGTGGCPRSLRPRVRRTSTKDATNTSSRPSRSCWVSGRRKSSSITASSPPFRNAASALSPFRSLIRRSFSEGSGCRRSRRSESPNMGSRAGSEYRTPLRTSPSGGLRSKRSSKGSGVSAPSTISKL